MHFFEFKVDSNTGWRVLKYTLSGLLSESILSGFGQEPVVRTLVRIDQFEP